jgi:UDP-glucose 4-epimerase
VISAWVIGAGGLLGAALTRQLHQKGNRLFAPETRFNWHQESELFTQINVAVRQFADQLQPDDRWEIYWAAGIGAMGSGHTEMAQETRALVALLESIASQPGLAGSRGAISFSSSAGAIYAATTAELITEDTPVAPSTPYAHEKLAQEAVLSSYSMQPNRPAVLVARLSTLYGSGQSSGKKQGLISHIARSMLHNRAVQIYVPFDTIRDYLYADDAAVAIVGVLRLINERRGVTMKIFASEQPTTIAEILSVFRRVTRHPPRIATSSSKLSGLYSRCVRFKSCVLSDTTPKPRTTLLIGVAHMIDAERANLVKPEPHNMLPHR